MLSYDKKILKELMIKRLNYSEESAERLSITIEDFHEELQESLDLWMKDETISMGLKVHGVSLIEIMEKRDCSFIDAMLTMTVFIENPAMAEKFMEIPKQIFMRY